LKRADEAPTRQFAGEGSAARTNERFHLLSKDSPSKRLSTAFDSVTLYGRDPSERPDIYGKVGNSGVSIFSVDEMDRLFEGFDLCAPSTSVSMTINGPAPAVLAMFMCTAIRQEWKKASESLGRELDATEKAEARARALSTVRGTVQADILKEDMGQNTCIFSTEFSLRMMGDIQQFYIDNKVRNHYSVSISGYHIAEAGANPITQLAFTLANGLTYVEYYRSRGMNIDDFAPNLSFFFSNGLDPEYTVIGRVARRLWAIIMRDFYGANPRSQMLKYHIQTSGRSLHAQEVQFNDIRTTLQALLAVQDNCNSLHTNAYDEAITTPTAESLRRAMAIQMIVNQESGWTKCENPLSGAFFADELTKAVENAVLEEWLRIDRRGGVLGAMEHAYQRSRIQDESLKYEEQKHSGKLPLIGVNCFFNENPTEDISEMELRRSTDEEKQACLARLQAFHERHAAEAPVALQRLEQAALGSGNIFDELMRTVEVEAEKRAHGTYGC
jgi:methylmalonyl-CoA mutase